MILAALLIDLAYHPDSRSITYDQNVDQVYGPYRDAILAFAVLTLSSVTFNMFNYQSFAWRTTIVLFYVVNFLNLILSIYAIDTFAVQPATNFKDNINFYKIFPIVAISFNTLYIIMSFFDQPKLDVTKYRKIAQRKKKAFSQLALY